MKFARFVQFDLLFYFPTLLGEKKNLISCHRRFIIGR